MALRTLIRNLLAVALVTGCPPSSSKEAKAIPSAPKAVTPSVQDARASAEGANFEVQIMLPATMTVGTAGHLNLELRAKGGFHLNEEYPVNFRPEGTSAGLKFERERYDLKTSAELSPCSKEEKDACQLRAQVPLTAAQAGTERAAGIVSFSVCNPDQCLIEKIPLAVSTIVH